MTDLPLAATHGGRFAAIDIARGVAIVAMVAYHLTWDLGPDFFGFIAVNAAEEPWLRISARIIAGSFLFLVGLSLLLAHQRQFRRNAFLRRFAIIAGAAIIVTVATRLATGDQYVRFGILHAIAAASLIGALFLRAPAWAALAVAAIAFAAPPLLASSTFNHPEWLWLGLSTQVPPMLDYVPILPWVGATLAGIGLTKLALIAGFDQRLSRGAPRSALARGLTLAGRWSLVIYVVHQPLLLGALYLIALMSGHQIPALF